MREIITTPLVRGFNQTLVRIDHHTIRKAWRFKTQFEELQESHLSIVIGIYPFVNLTLWFFKTVQIRQDVLFSHVLEFFLILKIIRKPYQDFYFFLLGTIYDINLCLIDENILTICISIFLMTISNFLTFFENMAQIILE